MDKVVVSYMEDDQKGAQLFIMLPFPLALVKPKKGLTKTSAELELNGLIPIVLTFESTPSGTDCDELSEMQFWPRGRAPLTKESDCIGGKESENEEESDEDSVRTSEPANAH